MPATRDRTLADVVETIRDLTTEALADRGLRDRSSDVAWGELLEVLAHAERCAALDEAAHEGTLVRAAS